MISLRFIPYLFFLALQVAANASKSVCTPPSLNPITLGFYTSEEYQTPVNLKVVGKIPKWLSGSLYRGGAGSWDSGNFTSEHWFDGFSRNHRFEISNGQVNYRSRNGSDELFDFVAETGRWPGGSFGGDPCKVTLGPFELTFKDETDPGAGKSRENIGIAYIPNFPGLDQNITMEHGPFMTLVVTTDANALQQIDPVTLEPITLFTYENINATFSGGRSASHPARGSKGQVYNYVMDLASSATEYKVFEIDATGSGRVLASVTDAPPAYLHSLFSTENYLILIVWQADYIATEKPTYNILDSMKSWDSNRKTLFYVIDKVAGGVIAKYTSGPFFAFHEINSFEDRETGSIVIDLPTMPNLDFLEAARLSNLRAHVGQPNATAKHDIPGIFRRYRLPGYADSSPRGENGTLVAREAVLDFEMEHTEGNIELPRINLKYLGKPYRYSYGVHIKTRGYFADSIVKIDAKRRRGKVWSPKTKHMPSEPIFVARPGGKDEDDGVVLTVALDSKSRQSYLVVLDAKSMREVGRAEMPLVMGYWVHGVWGGV